MKKIYKNKFLNKLVILIYFLLVPITSSAVVTDKKWSKECDDSKKVCVIAINHKVSVPKSDKKQVLLTAIIQLGTTIEKKMDLIDGEEKTYKLKEKNKLVPILTLRFPLNTNLKKQPLILVDKKKILNIPFSHCNGKVGCQANININNEVINLFKSGKQLTVVMAIYNQKNNMQVNLPLKGFTKAYDSLF